MPADPNSTFCVQRLEQECQNLSPKFPASIAAIDLRHDQSTDMMGNTCAVWKEYRTKHMYVSKATKFKGD